MNFAHLLWQQGRMVVLVSSFCGVMACGGEGYFVAPSPQAAALQSQTRSEWPASDHRAIAITDIESNTQEYPHEAIPQYAKLEITFQVENTVAGNFQLPYDPDPPNGIDQTYVNHQGISVDALFLPPTQTDWKLAYQQPAFYYESFADQIKVDKRELEREWYLPTGKFTWKARFAPNTPGLWHYKLTARDASGYIETVPYTFTVTSSTDPGFIHVSSADPRYFEFDNRSVFFGLGFNHDVALSDPVLKGEATFQRFQQNHINLLRIWISSLYGVAWNRYLGGRNLYDGYLPRSALLPFYDPVNQRYTMTMRLDYEPDGDTGWFDACRFEFWDDPEAVKPNTNYRVRIKYRGVDITGPRQASSPAYGFVAKLDYGWYPDCYEPGAGAVVTNYGLNNDDWQMIEGVWNSGNNNFLPRLYMGLENVTAGKVYVDSVSVQEILGNGQYGPEIMIESSMEYELHFPQAESYALDKLLAMAEKSGVYLKVVLMDKGDNIYFKFKDNGDFVLDSDDNLDGFYGVGRTLNKTRWLQQAWWRYVQARWGYSPHIHSWELTNEGDPFNANHYAATDELGKFMHCRVFGVPVGAGDAAKCALQHPNNHLVTTSFWTSFPGEQFWGNPKYPNVDYADLHAYISTGWIHDPQFEQDTAQFHLAYGAETRSNLDWYSRQNGWPTKPVIRGETGIDFVDHQDEQPDLALDSQGVWLHNLLWSTLDASAMSELYWWTGNIMNQPGPDGEAGLYEVYGAFYNFISTVPLNNGHYQDAEAQASTPNLRVVGQKDLFDQNAHLWIQNRAHTWRAVVDGAAVTPISATVTITGFQAGQDYVIQWWDTTINDPAQAVIRTETSKARRSGEITLAVTDLTTDAAIKIRALASRRLTFVFLPSILTVPVNK